MKAMQYTAVAGKYNIEPQGVKIHRGSGLFVNPIMDAKIFKILGHKYHGDCDVLIWHDANVFPKLKQEELIEKYLGESDICFVKHPYRGCIYEEFAMLKIDPRFKKVHKELAVQEQFYRDSGYPEKNGLYECNFFIRKVNPKTNILFEKRWAEVCRWTYRDQVCLPFVLSTFEVNMRVIDLGNIRSNPDFVYVNHYK